MNLYLCVAFLNYKFLKSKIAQLTQWHINKLIIGIFHVNFIIK